MIACTICGVPESKAKAKKCAEDLQGPNLVESVKKDQPHLWVEAKVAHQWEIVMPDPSLPIPTDSNGRLI